MTSGFEPTEVLKSIKTRVHDTGSRDSACLSQSLLLRFGKISHLQQQQLLHAPKLPPYKPLKKIPLELTVATFARGYKGAERLFGSPGKYLKTSKQHPFETPGHYLCLESSEPKRTADRLVVVAESQDSRPLRTSPGNGEAGREAIFEGGKHFEVWNALINPPIWDQKSKMAR